jgi:hypothetical protein
VRLVDDAPQQLDRARAVAGPQVKLRERELDHRIAGQQARCALERGEAGSGGSPPIR